MFQIDTFIHISMKVCVCVLFVYIHFVSSKGALSLTHAGGWPAVTASDSKASVEGQCRDRVWRC